MESSLGYYHLKERSRKLVILSTAIVLGIQVPLTGCSSVNLNTSEPETGGQVTMGSPLDEFRSLFNGSDWQNELLDDKDRLIAFNSTYSRLEELVAECMNDAGFAYLPEPERHTLALPAPDEWRPDDVDWVLLNGYGIFAYDLARPGGIRSEYLGVNREVILSNLSESGVEEWLRAYYGRLRDVAGLTGEAFTRFMQELQDNPTQENVGCEGWARNEVDREAGGARALNEFAPLFEALNEMYQNLEYEKSDFDHDWVICMANAGYLGFNRQSDARTSIEEAAGAIYDAWDYETDQSDPNRSPQMVALREHEIELALADLECRITTDFNTRKEQKRIAAETEFVNRNFGYLQDLRLVAENL